MNKNNLCVLILAAGKGSRMNSKTSKPLQDILGIPAISYILEALKDFNIKTFIVGNEEIYDYINKEYKSIEVIDQGDGGYGTGFAVIKSLDTIKEYEKVLVLQGDDPLISKDDLEKLLNLKTNGLMCAKYLDKYSSCSEVKVKKQFVKEINDKSFKSTQLVNLGRYIFNVKELNDFSIKYFDNHQEGEYKLPEIINLMIKNKCLFEYVISDNEFCNMNTKLELYNVTKILQKRINEEHIKNGVFISSIDLAFISPMVEIENDTKIIGNCEIKGKTIIGKNCIIKNSYIENSLIEEQSIVLFSFLENAIINDRVIIGPYAHLRSKSYIGSNAVIGNFVEVKNSTIGERSKARHLSYLGDAEIGKDCNIGCGSITANYDGKNKHHTIIGNKSFVGCNSTLVAPLLVGDNCFIAAGSTITKDVTSESLAFGRAKQVNKVGRAKDYLNKE